MGEPLTGVAAGERDIFSRCYFIRFDLIASLQLAGSSGCASLWQRHHFVFYTASAWWKVATKMQTTHECTSQPYHLGAGFMPIYSYHSTLTGTESQGWPLESEMMRLKSGGLTGFMAFCCIDVAQKCVVMLQQNCHSVSSQSGQHYNTSRTRGKNWKQNK